MLKARTLAVPTVFWVAPMHQIRVEGRFFAMSSPTLRSWSPGTPVTRSTSCGFHFFTSARISSMP